MKKLVALMLVMIATSCVAQTQTYHYSFDTIEIYRNKKGSLTVDNTVNVMSNITIGTNADSTWYMSELTIDPCKGEIVISEIYDTYTPGICVTKEDVEMSVWLKTPGGPLLIFSNNVMWVYDGRWVYKYYTDA